MKRILPVFALILACALLLPACGGAILETAQTAAETKTEPAGTAKTAPAPVTTEEKPLDPAADGILNILMVGASSCYYYVDELYGMLKAAGIDAEVWNLYYSGATTKMHWEWYLENSSVCTLYRTNKNGRTEYKDSSLKGALARRNWDVISLQNAGNTKPKADESAEQLAAQGMENGGAAAEKLVKLFRKTCPLAKLFWHQTWSYQVGYDRNGYRVPDKATQQRMYEGLRSVAHQLCEQLELTNIPSGDAWQIARAARGVGDVLCNRIRDGGDNYHDGDIGGGQYLNACVWFETLTGQSCIGNTFRPSYSLSEEKIAALQNAAHAAVAPATGT